MRQEIRGLVHQVDAQVVVLDPDMDVAAADQHPPDDGSQILAQRVVALLAGVGLLAPFRERMAGGGDGRVAEALGRFGHGLPQRRQLVDGLRHAALGAGADLHLALQVFHRDPLAEPVGAGGHEVRVRLAHEVARPAIDDEVLLFDADGERRSFGHLSPAAGAAPLKPTRRGARLAT